MIPSVGRGPIPRWTCRACWARVWRWGRTWSWRATSISSTCTAFSGLPRDHGEELGPEGRRVRIIIITIIIIIIITPHVIVGRAEALIAPCGLVYRHGYGRGGRRRGGWQDQEPPSPSREGRGGRRRKLWIDVWVDVDATPALESAGRRGRGEEDEDEEGSGADQYWAAYGALCLQLQLAHVLHSADTWEHVSRVGG
jgi:hypothetical protein